MEVTLDFLLNWIQDGMSINSSSAMLGLAALLRWIIVPLIDRVYMAADRPLGSVTKRDMVFVIGIAVAAIVSWVAPGTSSFPDIIFLGGTSALMAMGINTAVRVGVDSAVTEKKVTPNTNGME